MAPPGAHLGAQPCSFYCNFVLSGPGPHILEASYRALAEKSDEHSFIVTLGTKVCRAHMFGVRLGKF